VNFDGILTSVRDKVNEHSDDEDYVHLRRRYENFIDRYISKVASTTDYMKGSAYLLSLLEDVMKLEVGDSDSNKKFYPKSQSKSQPTPENSKPKRTTQ